MHWLTEPGIPAGQRNAGIDRSRMRLDAFAGYEDRYEMLMVDEGEAPVLLPPPYRTYAREERVGLPPGYRWRAKGLPEW